MQDRGEVPDLRWVQPRSQDIFAIWGSLDVGACRGEVEVLEKLYAAPELFILANSPLPAVAQPVGQILARRDIVNLKRWRTEGQR